jgi:hypothetical protein
MDGSVLSAPYDPESKESARARDTNPPRTEILTANNQSSALPPTRAVTPAPALPQATIAAPPPPRRELEADLRSPARAPRKSGKSKAVIAIAGLAVLGSVVLGIVLAVQFFSRKTPKVVMKTACGHAISQVLYDKWMQLGGETGKLGCPIVDESVAPSAREGATGRWIEFGKDDGAYLILRDHVDVYLVDGCIFKLYKQQGGTNSRLGFPTGRFVDSSDGGIQLFEGGWIEWNRTTRVCEMKLVPSAH